MYMQLVDLMEEGVISGKGAPGEKMNYADLYELVRGSLDAAHAEGRMKAEIIADPERFVDVDPDVPLALLDQKHAGKELLLITNSEWTYTAAIMQVAFDPYLPGKMTWRDLFDLAIVNSRKPAFFTARGPAFEVVSEDGMLREHYGPLQRGKVYVGGNAALVEASLGYKGQDILYVGDHLFTDVNISKSMHRWRTALVLRELEDELDAVRSFQASQYELTELMAQKVERERAYAQLRLALLRGKLEYASNGDLSIHEIEQQMSTLRDAVSELDERIAPLARESTTLLNEHWGLLTRTGNDKSLLARQLENYADVYTARVSNFLRATPYAYLRSHRGSLPHDAS